MTKEKSAKVKSSPKSKSTNPNAGKRAFLTNLAIFFLLSGLPLLFKFTGGQVMAGKYIAFPSVVVTGVHILIVLDVLAILGFFFMKRFTFYVLLLSILVCFFMSFAKGADLLVGLGMFNILYLVICWCYRARLRGFLPIPNLKCPIGSK